MDYEAEKLGHLPWTLKSSKRTRELYSHPSVPSSIFLVLPYLFNSARRMRWGSHYAIKKTSRSPCTHQRACLYMREGAWQLEQATVYCLESYVSGPPLISTLFHPISGALSIALTTCSFSMGVQISVHTLCLHRVPSAGTASSCQKTVEETHC